MKIYIDGGGFNGREARACILLENGKKEIITTTENKTNNTMEYKALLLALLNYANEGDTIYTDSQLLVGQVTKGWKINAEHLKLVAEECKKLVNNKKIKLIWIPRNENLAGKLIERKDEKI